MSETTLYRQAVRDEIPVRKFRRPGRPMTPGKYVFNELTQSFGYFIGHCDNCNAKFIRAKTELPKIILNMKHENRTLKIRLLHFLQRHLSD